MIPEGTPTCPFAIINNYDWKMMDPRKSDLSAIRKKAALAAKTVRGPYTASVASFFYYSVCNACTLWH